MPLTAVFRGLPMLRVGLTVALMALALAPLSGHAADVAIFGGGEVQGHGQSYSFLGADVTQPFTESLAFGVRLIPHYLTYKYRSGGDLIEAEALGVDLAVGLKLTLGTTYASLLAGIRARDTDLTPDVRDDDARGETIGPLVMGEFGTTLPSRTSISYFGSFGGADDFLYQKLTVKQQVTNLDYSGRNTIHVGGELFGGRNDDFSMIGAGPVVELYHIPYALAIAIKGGYRYDTTFGDGFYAGLFFYKGF
jgi:hypothetical protein